MIAGVRLPDGENLRPPRCAYWREENGTWSVCTPNGRIGSIAKHTVVEHADRTITVDPSILVYAVPGNTYTPEERARLVELSGLEWVESWERGRPAWHGHLVKGIWTELAS